MATVEFEQMGKSVFEVPVTVSVIYADGRIVDSVVPVNEQRVEWKLATTGTVREIEINRDHAAIAVFDRF
jgi:hypothetical protein